MAAHSFTSTSVTGEFLTQKAYTISGVPVIFPHKAYPPQIAMMDKIIKSMNKKHNCLLESPTGSGKSLALLCASLAWLKKTEKEIRENENTLNKHLDSYGVVFTDDVENKPKSVADFYKYKFQGNKNCATNNMKSDISLNNSDSYSATEEKNSSEWTTVHKPDVKSSKSSSSGINSNIDALSGSFSPYFHDPKSKRGITFVDEDLDDFQPIKRNKLFTDAQEMNQVAVEDGDCIILSSTKTSSQCESSVNDSMINNCPDSSCVSNPKTEKENQINNTVPPRLPKIFFGTRTHKQIGQIIRELKKTPYKDVKMTILSSRERTCIHPKNSRSRNKNEGCDELIGRREGPSCEYFKNVRKFAYCHSSELSSAFDLEDFVSLGRRKRFCPYFGARELLQNSEIVFSPYNYLVDPLIRSALNISLKDNIIIMDEAHNIEDSAREAASSRISISQLQEAIADVLQIGQLLELEGDFEPYKQIAKVLENLKKWLENSQDLKDYVTFDSMSKVWSGNDMLAVLDYVGLGTDTFPAFQANYKKILQMESETDKEKSVEVELHKLSGVTHMSLKSLTETLSYMFKDNLVYVPDYRCVVTKSKSFSEESSIVPASQSSRRKSYYKSDYEIAMNFWCLNPAVAFSDLKVAHSIIVASGTLAPLGSFQSELGIPFQITLEANHVINSENLWVGSIGRGPSNNILNGNFQNSSTFSFQDDIGSLVLKVCTLIPHGVLCFLPSYSMLDKLVNRWQVTGLWNKLLGKKVISCEPRRANEDFQQVMNDFYEGVKESESNSLGDINGALFLAVCRGKVSEGLDFADNNARAVITIGIPFPGVKDAQVDLKKKYNDMHSSTRQIVSGSAWYEMQAFRALNQALGRCIRHKDDFGALIIVDDRFQKCDRYTASLSKWIKKEIKHYSTYYDAFESLNNFAERMGLIESSEKD